MESGKGRRIFETWPKLLSYRISFFLAFFVAGLEIHISDEGVGKIFNSGVGFLVVAALFALVGGCLCMNSWLRPKSYSVSIFVMTIYKFIH